MGPFDVIPNKIPLKDSSEGLDIWPDLGHGFELNQFYRLYSGAEGWLGDGYLMVWSKQEVLEYRKTILEAYPEKYHFFASDGGGTQFGFFTEKGKASFISAPDIGDEGDIRLLGNWNDFLKSIQNGSYI